jgi:hypothetical protein
LDRAQHDSIVVSIALRSEQRCSAQGTIRGVIAREMYFAPIRLRARMRLLAWDRMSHSAVAPALRR